MLIANEFERGFAIIAMAMDSTDPDLLDILDSIKEGARRRNVIAERVDDSETSEPITERMLDSIEGAEFVIADLTHARPNVYYEAGYAHGIGKTPIYLMREGSQIHFDLHDYPVIKYNNMRSLKDKLAVRLETLQQNSQ